MIITNCIKCGIGVFVEINTSYPKCDDCKKTMMYNEIIK